MKAQALLLPYQQQWLADKSPLKIWEKSRRIGATYVQALEDVLDATKADNPTDVWFSSADDSAAAEYIKYVAMWATALNVVAEVHGEEIIDEKDGIKARSVRFKSGKTVYGLSSNPKNFRSKGGKVVLDEFAFHENPDELYRAAAPTATWGGSIRILSTYNGKQGRYWRMVEDAKTGKNSFSLHTTTIKDAIKDGIVSKIQDRQATQTDNDAFLQSCKDVVGDDESFLQEFMCQPTDGAQNFLSYDLITRQLNPDAGNPAHYQGGFCYIGVDIARRRDGTVITLLEQVGDVLWLREQVFMTGKTFAEQEDTVADMCKRYKVVRITYDQTGMGEKVVEDAKYKFGNARVEGVLFSNASKQYLATTAKGSMEDGKIRLPPWDALRADLYSLKKIILPTGTIRLDADRQNGSHADRAWSLFLAIHGASTPYQPYAFELVVKPARTPLGMMVHDDDETAQMPQPYMYKGL